MKNAKISLSTYDIHLLHGQFGFKQLLCTFIKCFKSRYTAEKRAYPHYQHALIYTADTYMDH